MNRIRLTLSVVLTIGIFMAGGHAARIKTQTSSGAKQASALQREAPAKQISQLPVPASPTELGAGGQVDWEVMTSGGGTCTLGEYVVGSSIGQSAAGSSILGNYSLQSGFWQDFGSGSCCVIRGDINHDGVEVLDIDDLWHLIKYMFLSGPLPACLEEADVNADGESVVDIADLSYLVNYMFLDGPPPPPCP